jgi:hypothetical protein
VIEARTVNRGRTSRILGSAKDNDSAGFVQFLQVGSVNDTETDNVKKDPRHHS